MPIKSEKVVFAIAKIITHKKKLEEDRNVLLTNLTKINNDLKQLTYTTSHDLRLPVSNLLSVFSLLDTSKIQDEETLEFIGMLKSSSEN
jgi:light-regulated signal transduction histidine kinase (bacteriophytochrome)